MEIKSKAFNNEYVCLSELYLWSFIGSYHEVFCIDRVKSNTFTQSQKGSIHITVTLIAQKMKRCRCSIEFV